MIHALDVERALILVPTIILDWLRLEIWKVGLFRMKQQEHPSAKLQNVIYALEFQAALHVNGPVLMARYSV